MLFADLLSLHLVTFKCFLFLFMSLFLVLELKFAIYYRAARLPSQASYAVWAEESQAFFKLSQHTNSISNSAILRNNYISLLSDLCACVHVKKNGVVKEAIVLQWAVRIASCDFQLGKKWWTGALLSENAAVLCENHRERVPQIWTSPSEVEEEEERKTFWLSGDFLVRCFRDAF